MPFAALPLPQVETHRDASCRFYVYAARIFTVLFPLFRLPVGLVIIFDHRLLFFSFRVI